MPIRFRCQRCRRLLSVSRQKAGSASHCPRCNASILIPSTDSPFANVDANNPRIIRVDEPIKNSAKPVAELASFGAMQRKEQSLAHTLIRRRPVGAVPSAVAIVVILAILGFYLSQSHSEFRTEVDTSLLQRTSDHPISMSTLSADRGEAVDNKSEESESTDTAVLSSVESPSDQDIEELSIPATEHLAIGEEEEEEENRCFVIGTSRYKES